MRLFSQRHQNQILPVGTSAHLRGLIDLDVFNDKGVYIQTFQVSVTLGILEHLKEESSTLLWPTTLNETKNKDLDNVLNETLIHLKNSKTYYLI